MRLLSRFMEPYGPFPSQQPGLADGVLLGPGRGSPNRGGTIALWQLLQNHGSSVHITSHPRLTTRLTGENRGLPPPILMRRTRGPCGAAGEVRWGSRASLTGFMRPGDAGSGGQNAREAGASARAAPGPRRLCRVTSTHRQEWIFLQRRSRFSTLQADNHSFTLLLLLALETRLTPAEQPAFTVPATRLPNPTGAFSRLQARPCSSNHTSW